MIIMRLKESLFSFFIRTLLALIMFFSISIYLSDDENYFASKDFFFSSNIDFSYIKSKLNVLMGEHLGIGGEQFVTSEKLNYKDVIKVDDSYYFTTDYNYVLNNLASGVVIFIGEQNKLGSTIIISSDDGTNYWYSNIENINVNLYDYIEKGVIIGSTIGNSFYLTLEKNGEYLNYEDYI